MRFVYPFTTEQDGDSILVEFPGIPGALTQVDPDEHFDDVVRDCLIAALGGYILAHRSPPLPAPRKDLDNVTLDVMTSAKLALAITLSINKISNVEFAEQLGVTEKVVRRLLDLDHSSRIDRLENALGLLGQQLELRVQPRKDHSSLTSFVH